MGNGASAKPNRVKLTYFNIRGRGEGIRMNLSYAGIKFEDNRIALPPQSDEWPKLKPSTPWGSMPVLEIDGRVYGQSIAIARHVGRITNMAGGTGYEQHRLDAVVDACSDLWNKLLPWFVEKDPTVKEAKLKAFEETATNLTEKMENFLGRSDFFGGSKLSWADLQFFALMEQCKKGGISSIFDSRKKLAALFNRISDLPKMRKYLANRPETPL